MIQYAKLNMSDKQVRENHKKFIDSLRGDFEVVYSEVGPKRSPQHNKFYRVILQMMSQYTGYTTHHLHTTFKKTYATEVKLDPNAKVTTADMESREFDELINRAFDWFQDFSGWDLEQEIYP